MWCEIVNDVVGGVPVSETFCRLCNTAVVLDRRVDERVLDFGTTGEPPAGIAPLARVVTIGTQSWSLDLVRERGARRILDNVVIAWDARQNSALGAGVIAEIRDAGNMMVQRETADGLIDVPYRVNSAFHAFHPESPIHIE